MVVNSARNAGSTAQTIKHPWDVTPKEAVVIQRRLRNHLLIEDRFSEIDTVCGVDVGFDRKTNRGKAALALLRIRDLSPIEIVTAEMELTFPYVPGLLSFRELPVVLAALKKLPGKPDLFICDGQGIAHPRRLGIACHLGLLTGIPAVGAAKSRLVGSHGRVPDRKGEWAALVDDGEVIGAVVRTRVNVKPIFVSPGHLITLESAVSWVMRCVTRYRLPETTRVAHKHSLIGNV